MKPHRCPSQVNSNKTRSEIWTVRITYRCDIGWRRHLTYCFLASPIWHAESMSQFITHTLSLKLKVFVASVFLFCLKAWKKMFGARYLDLLLPSGTHQDQDIKPFYGEKDRYLFFYQSHELSHMNGWQWRVQCAKTKISSPSIPRCSFNSFPRHLLLLVLL